MLDDQLEFTELLDDGDDVLPAFAGQGHHLDELVVLETVADDRGLATVGDGEDGEQLRLRPGLEAEVERPAEVEELLDHMSLLVHFDRVNAAIVAQVAGLGDGPAERVGDLPDPVAEDVGEADEDGDGVVLVAQLIDEVLEVDGLVRPLVRVDGDVAELVDPEVALAPVLDPVGLDGVGELPVADGFRVGTGWLDCSAHQRCPRTERDGGPDDGPLRPTNGYIIYR